MSVPDRFSLTYYRGRVALSALLKALSIGPEDSVAIQAFTCAAVSEGVMSTGARPLYVDIESDGFNMDPDSLAERITPDTRAIVVQHTFGIPAQMDRIMGVAERNGIPVIEDCCHSFLSTYNGQAIGTFGVGSFYLFEWGKPIVVGLGGSAAVNDPVIQEKIQSAYTGYRMPDFKRQLKLEMQYHGFGALYWPRFYWPVRSAFHALSTLGAAEGNFNDLDNQEEVAEDFSFRLSAHLQRRLEKKIDSIDRHATHSRKLVAAYSEQIDNDSIQQPKQRQEANTVYARYPLRVAHKKTILKRARKANVELAEWYSTPVHPLKGRELEAVCYQTGSCPRAETRASEVISLPTHNRVSLQFVKRAARFLNHL